MTGTSLLFGVSAAPVDHAEGSPWEPKIESLHDAISI
jgi:hypothetical protein